MGKILKQKWWGQQCAGVHFGRGSTVGGIENLSLSFKATWLTLHSGRCLRVETLLQINVPFGNRAVTSSWRTAIASNSEALWQASVCLCLHFH